VNPEAILKRILEEERARPARFTPEFTRTVSEAVG
jgi:hypothetical protein